MTAQAIATTAEASKSRPKRRVNRKLDHALDLLVDGTCRTQKAAAERAGIAPETLSRALRRHETRVLIEAKIENRVGAAKMKAASVLDSIMMDGKSEHARKDIAQWLLELQGYVVRKDASVQINNLTRISYGGNSFEVVPGYCYPDLGPPAAPALPQSGEWVSDLQQPAAMIDVTPNGPADSVSGREKP